MKLLTMDRAITRRRILRFNIALGLLVFITALLMNLTGEYSNLAELRAADAMFNNIALAGLLYAAGSFIFCVMSKPFWFPVRHKD